MLKSWQAEKNLKENLMGFLFGKKQTVQALAEVLEDGREKMNAEMKKPKFNNYSGPEVLLELNVRVQPQTEPAFEAQMKVGLLKMHLLKPGVKVRVKYNPARPAQVDYDDEPQAVLDRNPQLKKSSTEG
jgi:flagella basal body P-ring formation protein FlgA